MNEKPPPPPRPLPTRNQIEYRTVVHRGVEMELLFFDNGEIGVERSGQSTEYVWNPPLFWLDRWPWDSRERRLMRVMDSQARSDKAKKYDPLIDRFPRKPS